MRNKIRQMMKKEDGFTLVELLAVIVILGIILAIAIPAVSGVISNADERATARETELIVDAARLYETGENVTLGTDGVTVETLVDRGYLEDRGDETLNVNDKVIRNSDGDLEFQSGGN
ncbi:prepilin-type N-terminal cleavage/methylation domain-containing protein [Alkalibacterium pelagium]|uniref:Type IV pilus assembly protein PilA n=1 Tax=Alkalibacterium pelagium TaxID=426702 RepID=A0A1H7KU70_9LACT|nr:prepilin-type N-terminal cleavage/methylation domain-containing protein [Alkalibacterium pelagium]GEN50652.1 hypothetical protein APE02nite_13170 [Alkalibacterium pelagium]SEK90312.1 type IV pilus assembly protein PilA [Alkalibacterium pelagium]